MRYKSVRMFSPWYIHASGCHQAGKYVREAPAWLVLHLHKNQLETGWVTELVADPPLWSFTTKQNPFNYDPPLYIAVTLLPFVQFMYVGWELLEQPLATPGLLIFTRTLGIFNFTLCSKKQHIQ